MTRVRAHNIGVSLDGFATGTGQSLESPFGHAGGRLMSWFFPTATFQGFHPDGEIDQDAADAAAEDDAFARRSFEDIGAEIMGANKFGPPGWQDDPEWRGWWGDEPPFHTPVFVLTHRPRASFSLGDTTFHFIDANPRDALALAQAVAGDLDVRIGGGPETLREFLAADLVDYLHVAVTPIVLGHGGSLWQGLEGLEERFTITSTTTGSGTTHLEFEHIERA